MGALEALYRRFSDHVAFFVVYIKEAHPEDGWVSKTNRDEGIRVHEPTSEAERSRVAQECVLRLQISIPVLVDGPDNRAARAYGAWPDRLYLIGRDGHIAYQGEPGPAGFRPENLQTAIEAELFESRRRHHDRNDRRTNTGR